MFLFGFAQLFAADDSKNDSKSRNRSTFLQPCFYFVFVDIMCRQVIPKSAENFIDCENLFGSYFRLSFQSFSKVWP